VVASLLAFALAAGLLVAGNSGQRLPGQTLSGTDAAAASVAGQLQQAQTDLGNGRYLEAVKRFDAVIKQDPRNPEALAYRGWILHLTGNAAKDSSLINEAMASVQAAEAADPKYPDAHFFAGEILLRDRNDGAAAAAEFRQFLADNPPPAMIPEVQGELNAALAQAKASPATTAPAATAPPATTAPGR
jgi:tetratricopeptide (TPR) repeat protein